MRSIAGIGVNAWVRSYSILELEKRSRKPYAAMVSVA
jgi:hypothetical protein